MWFCCEPRGFLTWFFSASDSPNSWSAVGREAKDKGLEPEEVNLSGTFTIASMSLAVELKWSLSVDTARPLLAWGVNCTPPPGLAKHWNVPVRPPLGVYIVECAGSEAKSSATLRLCDLD